MCVTGYEVVCTVNMPTIVTMQTNDDVWVQCVCTCVCDNSVVPVCLVLLQNPVCTHCESSVVNE